MSTATPNPPRPASVPWGVALAAVSLLTVGRGALIWTHPHRGVAPGHAASPPDAAPGRRGAASARFEESLVALLHLVHPGERHPSGQDPRGRRRGRVDRGRSDRATPGDAAEPADRPAA